MSRALKLAKLAAQIGEVPVGAVIVNRSNNLIIAEAHNLMQQKQNPLLHAEIIAINKACEILGSKNLNNYDIYVSLEPCHMCAVSISFARLSRLFYGASDYKQGAVEHGMRYYNSASCYHRPEIYPDMNGENSSLLMKSFFKAIRKNKL